MSKKNELETMVDAVEKLGKFMMLHPSAVAGKLIEDGSCVFEPTKKNSHINKVFAISSFDVDELPPSVKTLLTSHKPE